MAYTTDLEPVKSNGITFEAWIVELEAVASAWDKTHGNLPYTLPMADSIGVGCWRDAFEDDLTPQEAFDSDKSCWGQ